ncbi:hypothetical protein TNCV_4980121 [Trichonephila clavipes]|nr:hypothetical protein TNCV_4980121 [Trichonephila clavipes]
MVVKGTGQQKFFQELGLFAISLETLPEFKDICDGTFPNPLLESIGQQESIHVTHQSIKDERLAVRDILNYSLMQHISPSPFRPYQRVSPWWPTCTHELSIASIPEDGKDP